MKKSSSRDHMYRPGARTKVAPGTREPHRQPGQGARMSSEHSIHRVNFFLLRASFSPCNPPTPQCGHKASAPSRKTMLSPGPVIVPADQPDCPRNTTVMKARTWVFKIKCHSCPCPHNSAALPRCPRSRATLHCSCPGQRESGSFLSRSSDEGKMKATDYFPKPDHK